MGCDRLLNNLRTSALLVKRFEACPCRLPHTRAHSILSWRPVDRAAREPPRATCSQALGRSSGSRSSKRGHSSAQADPVATTSNGRDYTLIGVAALCALLLYSDIREFLDVTSPRGEPSQSDFIACIKQLRTSLPPACVSLDFNDLRSHGIGVWTESPTRALPGVVVYPRDAEDVVAILQSASRYKIPVIPHGAGTSIEGQINAPCCGLPKSSGPVDTANLQPGISISVDMCAHMNEIVAIHENDLQVTVQPGISYESLNAQLQEAGTSLFFPIDPGPGASIGGMVACGASGTNAVRYGTMREAVLNLTVVLPSGQIIKTRSRASKSSAGPDLTKLFVGSEGTLGIIVEATLKLAPILPTSVGLLTCPTIADAAGIVAEMLKSGVVAQCIELLDENMIRAVNAASLRRKDGLRPLQEKPTLLIKLQGDEMTRMANQKRIAQIAKAYGCSRIAMAKTAIESDSLWRARKVALNSAFEMAPRLPYHSTDVCVPISRFPLLMEEFKADLARLTFPFAGIVGHAGDGNIHSIILYETAEQDQAALDFADREDSMARRAIELEGTLAGEHGVGVGKRHLLRTELGDSVDLLLAIKHVIDPQGIMNPLSLFPDPRTQ